MQLIDLAVQAALKAGELLSKPTERVEISLQGFHRFGYTV